MEEVPYSKREMDYHFRTLNDRLTKQDSVLVRIEQQTTKTNGRVNKHDWQIKAAWWAAGVMGALLIFLLPYIMKLISKVEKLDYTITALTEEYRPE